MRPTILNQMHLKFFQNTWDVYCCDLCKRNLKGNNLWNPLSYQWFRLQEGYSIQYTFFNSIANKIRCIGYRSVQQHMNNGEQYKAQITATYRSQIKVLVIGTRKGSKLGREERSEVNARGKEYVNRYLDYQAGKNLKTVQL